MRCPYDIHELLILKVFRRYLDAYEVLPPLAMRRYLDDDLDANALIGLLQHEGHEVVSPRAVASCLCTLTHRSLMT